VTGHATRANDVNSHKATRVAWTLWVLAISGLVFSLVFNLVTGTGDFDLVIVAFASFVLAFSTVGALIGSRQPRNPIGWVMCAMALAFVIGGVAVTYTGYSQAAKSSLPGETLFAWLGNWSWGVALGLTSFLLLLFPYGRLPSPRWRIVAWGAACGTLFLPAGVGLKPGPLPDTSTDNPVGIPGTAGLMEALESIGVLLIVVSTVASAVSVIVRFRRSRGEERQQLKWLTYAAALVAAGLAASIPLEATGRHDQLSNFLTTQSLTFIPVCIGIAILRYRLYDIDLIINRTLVYGALTALLALVYLAIVVALQNAIPGADDSDLTIAGSTLAVAALFQPLRTRVQGFIDRRFYRHKVDAQRTLEAFSAHLRDEVELNHLQAQLIAVVGDTMQPAHASLWLRSPAAGPR
jgi:hypothetical protein